MSITDDILKLEEQRTQAILKADGPTMEKLFDDELVYIHSSGRLDTKRSYIDGLTSGKSAYKSFKFANVKVRVYGDCALVSGDVVIELPTRTLDLRFTNVWVKGGPAGWRHVHWQSVPRPQA